MLTTASQFTPRARSLKTQHAVAAQLLAARQQARGFRFGMWSSYFDEDFHRECRKRHRMLKHKYAEHINRRLSWDKHPFAEDKRHALKRMMNSYWHSHNARPGGRYYYDDDAEPSKQRTPLNEDGARPGQNIEDVERGAMDHLMFGEDSQCTPHDQATWRARRVRLSRAVQQTPHGTSIQEDEFIIDPITNRKVAKEPPISTDPDNGTGIPVKTFKEYGSKTEGPALASEKTESRARSSGDAYFTQSGIDPDTKDSYNVNLIHDQADTVAEDKEAAHDHPSAPPRDSQFNDPKFWENGLLSSAPRYDKVHEYGASFNNDASRDAGDGMKDDDLHKYRPIQHLEPDEGPRHSTEGAQKSMHIPRDSPTLSNPRERFDDLKPQYTDFEAHRYRESVADEIASRFKDSEVRDTKHCEPTQEGITSAQDVPAPASQGIDHTTRNESPGGKPWSFEEELVKPEVLRKYQSSIEQREPEESAESTAEDLRARYSQTEPDQHDSIAPERSESVDQSETEALRNLDQRAAARDEQSNHRDMLDALMKQYEHLSDVADTEARIAVRSAKAKAQQGTSTERKLTGNYVRDFPEDFEKSWTQTLSSAPTESAEASYSNGFQAEGESMDGGLEGGFGHPTPNKIQPALDRQPARKSSIQHANPYTKEPQRLERAVADDESGEPKQTMFMKHYRSTLATEEAERTRVEQSSAPAPEPKAAFKEITASPDDGPTRYRILAYDPVMQKVNMAETTSLVHDFSCALSPADAIVRLSQPMKFFPFFATLEAEGFDIVSGSGDMLIFRKARPSLDETRRAGANAGRTPVEAEPRPTEAPVNPIDMTGRVKMMSPASANFASPTGYVAYDNLPETEASNLPPPPPRVKYNIDLRREEPVFSGPKYRADSGKKSKKGMFKRLLAGGVWVAGISYGLGVVSEYFSTGGIDGRGPTGF